MLKRNNAGFTLIEVMIAIVVLGLIVMPICTSLIMSVRMNDKAESMLQAKLAVSSAVETMMANGISEANNNYVWYEGENPAPNVTVKTVQATDTEDSSIELPYYNVTVTYTDDDTGDELVSVTTHIRETGGGGT